MKTYFRTVQIQTQSHSNSVDAIACRKTIFVFVISFYRNFLRVYLIEIMEGRVKRVRDKEIDHNVIFFNKKKLFLWNLNINYFTQK